MFKNQKKTQWLHLKSLKNRSEKSNLWGFFWKNNQEDFLKTSEANFRVENDQNDKIVNLSTDDHDDLSKIMDSVITDLNSPPRMKELLVDQQRNIKEKKHGLRWSKSIIHICLTM